MLICCLAVFIVAVVIHFFSFTKLKSIHNKTSQLSHVTFLVKGPGFNFPAKEISSLLLLLLQNYRHLLHLESPLPENSLECWLCIQ